MADVIRAFKGFDPDFCCRGFHYEVGRTYEHEGEVKPCASGFHACENPWDVLAHYDFVSNDGRFNRFAEVEQSGVLKESDDSKIASSQIGIVAELPFATFVSRLIEASATGSDTRIASSGRDSRIVSSGSGTRIVSSGFAARIASSGFAARIASSGFAARIASSGEDSRIASSGEDSHIASSGEYARIASSGWGARIASSGSGTHIASSGMDSRIASSGLDAAINAEGSSAVIACAGSVARFRLGPGGCIAIPWHDGSRTRFVALYEGEQIEAGVWYRLNNKGEPVEAETQEPTKCA